MPAETRVDRHDQDQVQFIHHMFEVAQRRRRIEYQARFAAVVADQLQAAIDVLGTFRMETDDVGASLGKVGNDAVDRLDHQVHIDWYLNMRANGFADQGANCQIRNIMIVHDIKMDDVGTGGHDVSDFFAKTGKIGGQDTGGDVIFWHGAHSF